MNKNRVAVLVAGLTFVLSSCGEPTNSAFTPAAPLKSLAANGQVKSIKRGIAYNLANEADLAALAPGVSWWYNWSPSPDGGAPGDARSRLGAEFVPMIWGDSFDTADVERRIRSNPAAKYMLVMNEPSLTSDVGGANISPQRAAEVWPRYEQVASDTGVQIVGPQITWGTMPGFQDPVVWMDAFYAAYRARNGNRDPRIDALGFHWYDYGMGAQLDRLKKYNKPYWVTEFANWHPQNDGAQIDTPEKQKAQMAEMVATLESRSDVVRYSWFTGRWDNDIHSTSLLGGPGQLTDLGRAYLTQPFTFTSAAPIPPVDGAGGGTGSSGTGSSTVELPTNVYKSLQVTTPGFTNRFVRHSGGLGFTEIVNAASDPLLKRDATFRIVKGLASDGCYSLQSLNFPGEYLRHQDARVRKDANDGSEAFRKDATWCANQGLAGGMSLSAYSAPDRYLRHFNGELWLAKKAGPLASDRVESFEQDSNWTLADPLWQSGVELPQGPHSLQVTTPGYTDRVARHAWGLGFTSVISSGSPELDRKDSTFNLVSGLANPACYSLEASNFKGQYLRHNQSRVRLEASDNSEDFKKDATWCTQPGLSGTGVTFESASLPGHFLRHFGGELWLAKKGGSLRVEGSSGFEQDVSWNLIAPLAP
jgi:Glycosyl hydrolase catalytic core/Alpha-L-arabinofuranosidase B (ABFB) domain